MLKLTYLTIFSLYQNSTKKDICNIILFFTTNKYKKQLAMGFGGSVSAMIASLKANKRTRVSTFKKIKNFNKVHHSKLHFHKKASPLELKKIRDKIVKENEKNFKRKVIILVVSIILLLFLLN